VNTEISAGTPAQDQYGDSEQRGYCIEIYVGPDNQVQSISVQRKDGEEQEGHGSGQPVSSIDEALQAARQLYEQGGAGTRSDDLGAMDGYRGNGQRRNVAGIDDVFSRG
jgi:hypothetical protein